MGYAVAYVAAYAGRAKWDYANLKIQQEKFKSQIACVADKRICIQKDGTRLEISEIKLLEAFLLLIVCLSIPLDSGLASPAESC